MYRLKRPDGVLVVLRHILEKEWTCSVKPPPHFRKGWDHALEACALHTSPWCSDEHADPLPDKEIGWMNERMFDSSPLSDLEFQPKKRGLKDRPWGQEDPVRMSPDSDVDGGASESEFSESEMSGEDEGSSEFESEEESELSGSEASASGSEESDASDDEGHPDRQRALTDAGLKERDEFLLPPKEKPLPASGLSYHAWEMKMRELPMSPVPSLDELRRKNASNDRCINEDVMSVLADPNVLEVAFYSMYARHGPIEEAKQDFESFGRAWLPKLSSRLLSGVYTFPQPIQLEPKYKLKPKRMDNVPVWWHKLVPESMRLILEAVFEPRFSRLSHGYRPGKGCYTALKEVKYNFGGVDYFIECDVSKSLADFDKTYIMEAVKTCITDPVFLSLLHKAIRGGYLDLAQVSHRNIGISQTTLLSPILCNIYLHKLDMFMEDLIRCLGVGGYDEGSTESRVNILSNRDRWATPLVRTAKCWREWTLSQVRYVRYGGNFLIGLFGTDGDVSRIERDLQWFIRSEMKLDTRKVYCRTADARIPDKEYVLFLGSEIYVAQQISSPGIVPASREIGMLLTQPRLCVPARYLLAKMEESGFIDGKRRRPKFNGRIVNWEVHEIVKFYDITVKMFFTYYSFADNHHCLYLLFDILRQSCALTLGKKLGLKRIWYVTKRFGRDLVIHDNAGNVMASLIRPRYRRPQDPFVGRDMNPIVRIEKQLKPRFPPTVLKPVTSDSARQFLKPHWASPAQQFRRDVPESLQQNTSAMQQSG